MLLNYLKIAFRNLTKRKGYTILNIFGLALGVTCCLLIFQYVSFEKSYEQFNKQADNIVRLRLDQYQHGTLAWKSATIYPAIGPTLKKEFPDVIDFCRLHDAEFLLSNESNNYKFNEKKGYYADPSAISMLDIQLTSGDAKTALDAPGKLMLSQSMAKKYFNNENPLGKMLVSKGDLYPVQYLVTGVFKDYPKNSHLIIDYLASYASLGKLVRDEGDTANSTETSFGWYDFYTYLKLRPGTNLQQFQAKLPAFCNRHMNKGQNINNDRNELYVLPMTDIHLYSNYNQEAEVNGDGQTVSFLFLIGILIIVIAWINYVNLATARSVERAREVGVRKVLGAARASLIKQFLVESMLLNLVALVIAWIAAYLLTPMFNRFTGHTATEGLTLPALYWIYFWGMFFAGSLLAGIYPAFVLSGFQPVKVLKGLFKNSSSGLILRKSLIIAQFITSVVLVAGTIIVYQQLNYMRSQKLGANIDQTLVLSGASSLEDSTYQDVFQPFKQDLHRLADVKTVSSSTSVMGNEIYWTSDVRRVASESKGITLYHIGVDYDFIPAFAIEMKAGRNFSKSFKTDNRAVLLNETAVKLLGFENAEKAVGQKVVRGDTLTIAGVVADFHHQGLQKKVEGMIFLLRPNSRQFYSVKLGGNRTRQTVASVEKIWSKYFPADPFSYFFLDESFNMQYQSDELFGKIFSIFSGIAILIACFGLAGLSAYNTIQRRKEIGIRKIMGASVQQLLVLLSKDFLKLVIIAFLAAIPISWLIMNRWLQDFAYRININAWVFGVAGAIAFLIAFATISFQAVRAAMSNPVNSLRTE